MTRREDLRKEAEEMLTELGEIDLDKGGAVLLAFGRRLGAAFADLAGKVDDLTTERDDARAAIRTLREYASKTHGFWIHDKDPTVGNCLAAMAGHSDYDAAITAALKHGEVPE